MQEGDLRQGGPSDFRRREIQKVSRHLAQNVHGEEYPEHLCLPTAQLQLLYLEG